MMLVRVLPDPHNPDPLQEFRVEGLTYFAGYEYEVPERVYEQFQFAEVVKNDMQSNSRMV